MTKSVAETRKHFFASQEANADVLHQKLCFVRIVLGIQLMDCVQVLQSINVPARLVPIFIGALLGPVHKPFFKSKLKIDIK